MFTEFATFDFETTGFSPKTNRVIEIGIVRTDEHGRVLGEFSSLINPGRDVGRTDIHKITAGMLADAPTFDEVAGDIAEFLNGAILVAHNARFDAGFLSAELERTGREFEPIDALCTLELMFAGFPSGPRKLVDCCEFLEVPLRESHLALSDAQMTSELLHRLLDEVSLRVLPNPALIQVEPASTRGPLQRSDAVQPRERESHYLAKLVQSLPSESNSGVASAVSCAQYLNLLDRVLEDRRIDKAEADEILEFALAMDLSSDRIAGLNGAYMVSLCAAAMADGIITDSERRDLETVATLLKVGDWEELLGAEKPQPRIAPTSLLEPGMSVCFTGEMAEPRPSLTVRSQGVGLEVKNNVSKKLDLLVVADSDSTSGKARKARELGIRIVAENVFMTMLKQAEN